MSSKVARNTAFMTGASVAQKVISFVYFTLIARTIGVEGTGKYFFALAFTTVFVIFVDLGFTSVLIREVAKTKEKIQEYLATILSIKLVTGALSYVTVALIITCAGYEVETVHLVYLSGITMLFDSLHLTLYGVLRAIGDLKWEAIGIIGSQLLTLALGTTFLYLDLPLIFLILAFTISSACNVFFVLTILLSKYHISLRLSFQRATFFHLGRIAVPFAIAAIFARVYSYADTLILSKLGGDLAVGWYSIPYKISFAFQFIPLALIATLYPRFSEYFAHDKEKLCVLFEQGTKYLLIIAYPIAFGVNILAKDIVLLLYTTDYLPSVLPLQILMISLLFSFVSFPIGALLNACDRQKTQTAITGIILVVNVTLNLVLIPYYGVVGAAIAALVGNALLATLGYLVVPSITRISHSFFVKTKIQLLLSVFVMSVAVWYTNRHAHFSLAIVVGALVYTCMLFATQTVKISHFQQVRALLR